MVALLATCLHPLNVGFHVVHFFQLLTTQYKGKGIYKAYYTVYQVNKMKLYKYLDPRGKKTYLFRANLTKAELDALLEISKAWELVSVTDEKAVFKPKHC